jgi:hypothetical protein
MSVERTLSVLLALAAACAAGCASSARIAVADTTPRRGSPIEEDTVLRVEAAYAVDPFTPGQDGIAVVFKSLGGTTWAASRQTLAKAEGRVTLEVSGAELAKRENLVRPLQMRLVLDTREAPDRLRIIKTSAVVFFGTEPIEEPKQVEPVEPPKNKTFVPPRVTKGRVLVDIARDPRYKPVLPPSLNKAGMVVWGLFKTCVDSDGDVYSVKVIKSAHRDVDADWMNTIRSWKHQPYAIGDRPVPYCYPVRLEVRSQM